MCFLNYFWYFLFILLIFVIYFYLAPHSTCSLHTAGCMWPLAVWLAGRRRAVPEQLGGQESPVAQQPPLARKQQPCIITSTCTMYVYMPANCVVRMCMTCHAHTHGHPSVADEAWHWLKCVLHIGWLSNTWALRAVNRLRSCPAHWVTE